MRGLIGRIGFRATPFAVAVLFSAIVRAQAVVHFDIPAQLLARSLNAIGAATNTDIGFSADQVAGIVAPSLKADLTVDSALIHVLAGTGLRLQRLDDHTIVIVARPSSGTAEMKRSALASVTTKPADPPRSMDAAADLPSVALAQADSIVPADTTGAQDSNSQGNGNPFETIIVTGSHISGIENKTDPIIVIDQTQIEQSGYASTQDLFLTLPQNYAGGSTTQAGFIGAGQINGDFSSAINLRGLGSSSTLVLLNGHRMASAIQGTAVDVSSVPLAAIERIEILTDGASAIYGSDAVGGVVNIITKRDYDGADTSARIGSVTSGSRQEDTIAQILGKSWPSGNITGTLQYQDHSRLDSHDRDFTAAVPSPTDLLPAEHTYSGMISGRQGLSDSVSTYLDALWSKRDFDQNETFNIGDGFDFNANSGSSTNVNVAAGVKYIFAPNWSIEVNGLYARQHTEENESYAGVDYSSPGFGPQTDFQVSTFDEDSIDLLLNGKVAKTRAGDVGIAVGASYRREDPSVHAFTNGTQTGYASLDRTVRAFYAEAYAPFFGDRNALPGLRALALSAAIRSDHYSDFGQTTNPRVGLFWSPVSSLSFRASYGTSFRAPTEYEIAQGVAPPVAIESLGNPNGPGTVPVIVSGVASPLTAEKASTTDFGIEYRPSGLGGIDLQLNYYDVLYKNRIIEVFPPINALSTSNVYGQLITALPSDAAAQAYLNGAIAAGGDYLGDLSTNGGGTTGVRYAFDVGLHNASIVRQSGFDFLGSFVAKLPVGKLSTQINATMVDKIDTAYSPGAAFANLVGTYGSPPKWRLRTLEALTTKGWEVSAAVSFTGSYVNTSALGTPAVSSWTTMDLGARVHLDTYLAGSAWKGSTLGISALNVLNRDPPFVSSTITSEPIHFDPTNASPLGRFISVDIKKRW